MQTERGTKLLTSGWWGLSRHPNYMYVAQHRCHRTMRLIMVIGVTGLCLLLGLCQPGLKRRSHTFTRLTSSCFLSIASSVTTSNVRRSTSICAVFDISSGINLLFAIDMARIGRNIKSLSRTASSPTSTNRRASVFHNILYALHTMNQSAWINCNSFTILSLLRGIHKPSRLPPVEATDCTSP